MSKIIRIYRDTGEKPLIETVRNTFEIIFSNINVKYDSENAQSHGLFPINDVIELLEI